MYFSSSKNNQSFPKPERKKKDILSLKISCSNRISRKTQILLFQCSCVLITGLFELLGEDDQILLFLNYLRLRIMKRLFMQFMKITKISSMKTRTRKDQHKVECHRYVH